MKITLKRSGGYAGLSEKLADLDTSKMPPQLAAQVSQLIENTGFFNSPATIAGSVGADTQKYEIIVVDGAKHHSVTFSEDSPEGERLMKLVQNLRSFA